MAVSRNKVFNSFIWRFLEKGGAQIVTFIVGVVLARVLGPDRYGEVTMLLAIIEILQVFVDSGMTTALIQKKEVDDTDFSSVFVFNILLGILLYLLLFVTAPLLTWLMRLPHLTAPLRVVGLVLVVGAIRNVQQAYVTRELQFKRFFFSTLGGTIASGAVGIGMALVGYGVWALVAQQMVNIVVGTIILWATVHWRPKKSFSGKRLKTLFDYGWKIFLPAFIDKAYVLFRKWAIKAVYTDAGLAFYTKGSNFPGAIVSSINTTVDSVLLPVMSSSQDDKNRVRLMTRRAMKTSTYIMAPLMIGLACVAEPFVRVLLGDEWLGCVLFLRVFCLIYLFQPIQTANLNAIKAMGRSDIFLKLDIVKRIITLILLLSTLWVSVEAVAYGLLVNSLVAQIINSWPNRKLLDYTYLDQLRDIFPNLFLGIVMGAVVLSVQLLGLTPLLTLCIQVPMGAILYLGGSVLLKMDTFTYLLDALKGKRGKKDEPTA